MEFRQTLGVVGGMGPLASNAFLDTLYHLHLGDPEQRSPRVVVISDPTIPDRTEALLAGDTAELVAGLERAIEAAVAAGAGPVMIACITAHQVLDRVAAGCRERVVSLLDLVVDELAQRRRPHLLLTTSGTRAPGLFESHPRWGAIEPWARQPPEDLQAEIHRRLYELKKGAPPEGLLSWLDDLHAAEDGIEGFVFGCTELHLLQPALRKRGPAAYEVVDPLLLAARELPRLLG